MMSLRGPNRWLKCNSKLSIVTRFKFTFLSNLLSGSIDIPKSHTELWFARTNGYVWQALMIFLKSTRYIRDWLCILQIDFIHGCLNLNYPKTHLMAPMYDSIPRILITMECDCVCSGTLL